MFSNLSDKEDERYQDKCRCLPGTRHLMRTSYQQQYHHYQAQCLECCSTEDRRQISNNYHAIQTVHLHLFINNVNNPLLNETVVILILKVLSRKVQKMLLQRCKYEFRLNINNVYSHSKKLKINIQKYFHKQISKKQSD